MGFFVKFGANHLYETPYILMAMTAALLEAGTAGRAQCTYLALNVSLGAGQTESTSIFLSGDLTSFTVNLNFTGAGGIVLVGEDIVTA